GLARLIMNDWRSATFMERYSPFQFTHQVQERGLKLGAERCKTVRAGSLGKLTLLPNDRLEMIDGLSPTRGTLVRQPLPNEFFAGDQLLAGARPVCQHAEQGKIGADDPLEVTKPCEQPRNRFRRRLVEQHWDEHEIARGKRIDGR